jgi:pyrroloquinoline quinone biosynthesis protein D
MERLEVSATSVLRLAPHIVFRFDDTRQRWIMMAPERLMLPDEQAVEILQLVDGKTGVGAIIDALALHPGAARADRHRRHRHAAGSRGQGMSCRCLRALTRPWRCSPS